MTATIKTYWPTFCVYYTVRHAFRFALLFWVVRAAVPKPILYMLIAAACIKCLPVDFGTDEALTAIALVLLRRYRPGLARVISHAAELS